MTNNDFLNTLFRLRELGFATKRTGVLTTDEILAAVERCREEEQGTDALGMILRFPENPPGRPQSLRLGLTGSDSDDSRKPIDFSSEDAIGRLDTERQRVSLEHTRLKPGTVVYVGFVAEGVEPPGYRFPRPTPFTRSFHEAVLLADNFERATTLAALADRLAWSDVKESVLAEAFRSARMIEDRTRRADALAVVASEYPPERQRDFLEEAGEREPVSPPALVEPPLDDGWHWGRFVMLRHGLRHAIAYLSAAAYLRWPQTAWCAYFKEVCLAAEVEVAPELMRTSLQEAVEYDPDGIPLWREWLLTRLPDCSLRTNLLALLPEHPA